MARVRTFIAIEIGRSAKARCLALQASLKREVTGARWTTGANLHLTLSFLGDLEDRDLNVVCKAVELGSAGHAAFGLSVEGLGCFPNPEKPRVLWAGIGGGVE